MMEKRENKPLQTIDFSLNLHLRGNVCFFYVTKKKLVQSIRLY